MRYILLLLLFSLQAHAAEYQWSAGSLRFSTPELACRSYEAAVTRYINRPATYLKYTLTSAVSARCQFSATGYGAEGFSSPDYYARRTGDSCPPGQVWDSTIGICKNPCTEKKGQQDNFYVNNISLEMCRNSCELAFDNIVPIYDSSTRSQVFHFMGVYTGETCSTDTSILPGVTPPEPTSSEMGQECTATSVTTDSEGRRHETSSCTTTTTDQDNQKCVAAGGSVGSFNGMMTCIAANKGPKLTETEKVVEKKTETKPDGAKKTTTTTTTNVTKCSGSGGCKTTTTTVTTTTNSNADGTAGYTDSVCKGANCGTDGKEKDDGDGKGAGNAGGEGDEEEEEEGIPGPSKNLGKGEQGSFAEGLQEWDDRIAEARGELDAKVDQYSALFSGVFDLNLGSGGGELPCDTIPVSFGSYGSTTLNFCIADYADVLSYLRYVLLLTAAAVAAIIILKG